MLPGWNTQPVRPVCRRGFTIIELVIILVVLGLLGALILPALAHARHQSRANRCIDNSRHIGAAFATYADNNDGRFVPFKKNEACPGGSVVPGASDEHTYWPDLLREYAGHEDIWHCPSCRGQFGIGYSALVAGGHVKRESELAAPAATVVFGDTDVIANPSDVPDAWRPSEATVGEARNRLQFEIPSSPKWRRKKGQGARRIWNRHMKRATVVFADQHAEVLPVSHLGFQENASVPQRLWDEQ